jgi:hypothetical protein
MDKALLAQALRQRQAAEVLVRDLVASLEIRYNCPVTFSFDLLRF